MEAKYKRYRDHDWSLDSRWQTYFNNIYPIPPQARLEKMRRRWYKTNVDKDFDPDFQPSEQ